VRNPFVEVVSRAELQARVFGLGEEITAEYAGRDPVLIGVMKGSIPFLADLIRTLDFDLDVEFLGLTRFGHEGQVSLSMDTEHSITGRDVLIVEEIVDTGLTLASLLRMLEARDPASLATVALLDKAPRRIVEVPLEYRGFEVGDEYLIGYGLSWEGRFRNLPSLWAALDFPLLQADPEAFARAAYRGRAD
jgi:hypoxanthine phosphoribosyltransferase